MRKSDTPRTDAAELNFGEMPGLMKQMERELNAANARVRELESQQPPAPQYLDSPDKPGDWWLWVNDKWVHQYVIHAYGRSSGIWLPATPPPPPKEEL